jgi:hypothetical protein
LDHDAALDGEKLRDGTVTAMQDETRWRKPFSPTAA